MKHVSHGHQRLAFYCRIANGYDGSSSSLNSRTRLSIRDGVRVSSEFDRFSETPPFRVSLESGFEGAFWDASASFLFERPHLFKNLDGCALADRSRLTDPPDRRVSTPCGHSGGAPGDPSFPTGIAASRIMVNAVPPPIDVLTRDQFPGYRKLR